MAKLSQVAFLGFGEAGQAIMSGWSENQAPIATAYDIKTDNPSLRKAKLTDYIESGVQGCFNLGAALSGATAIFSLVTADQARVAAEHAALHIQPGQFYFDCNSCSPDSKRMNARLIEQAGGKYVDVAIMSPIHPKRHQTPVLISGPHVAEAKKIMEQLEMNLDVIDGDIGAASSVKMIRSIVVKGMEALMAESFLSAKKANVEDYVLSSLEASHPGINWRQAAAYNLERMMVHGQRRAAEMREVALTVEQLELDNAMAQATVKWQEQIGVLALKADSEEFTELANTVLKRLAS
ncbi:NAD(P)-dependent oxidoreductase [Photobacterium rosenbergii]|uniref:NAD(P)-dependent oxidoreductase n=1 Tax=Photobacterium rosenbergii TaxID=294936 RepID=UPI001C99CCED|nr:NAD(P)-dependent oxidoreductase [Photobacterium rosenbergii]MBY5945679.1 DUF1932 domain-containing protein [Photobacterium rosenbergii]